MAEIQIKTILDTSSFDAGVKAVQAKITALEGKTVNIRFNKTSSSNFANNLKKEIADSATAMQRQINAITGVDRGLKSAADSADYFKKTGLTAFEEQIKAVDKFKKKLDLKRNFIFVIIRLTH